MIGVSPRRSSAILGILKLNSWPGKVGKQSAAAKYGAATASSDFSIEEAKPYAEVWEDYPID